VFSKAAIKSAISPLGHSNPGVGCNHFNPARQTLLHTYFAGSTFRLWTAVQQHWLLPVTCGLAAATLSWKQCYKSVNKLL